MPIDVNRLISEVTKGGLQNEQTRLDQADKNFDFFEGRFDAYPTREESLYYHRADRRRTTRFMRRVVEVLTETLYKKPPTRELSTGAEAKAWLDRCYAINEMSAVWPKADQYATVADVAALLITGSEDEGSLVDIQLWGANEFLVWTEPGKPRTPAAVAVADKFDASARLRLWTAAELVTFVRPKDGPRQTAGGRTWELRSVEPNVYGIIPFEFIHHETPTVEFWTRGPGDFLQRLNDNLNGELDAIGDAIQFGLIPILLAKNVGPDFVFPSKLKPGQALRLQGSLGTIAEDDPPDPGLEFVTPPLEHIAVAWDDVNRTIDRGLEDAGIPPGTIRMVGDAASGVAILMETGPLVKKAEGRRSIFDAAENRVARKCAQIAAAHLRYSGRPVPAWLDATAAEPTPVSVRWAPLYIQLPGAERDRSDEWLLGMELTDKVEILMSREGLTESEALVKLARIARRNAQVKALGLNPGLPAPTPTPGAEPSVPANLEPQTAD